MSINKVILIGRVVDVEPEVRCLDNGEVITFFTLSTEIDNDIAKYTGSNSDCHSIILRQNLADVIQKKIYLDSFIYVEGKLYSHYHIDEQEIRKYVIEIWADDVQFLEHSQLNGNPKNQRQPCYNSHQLTGAGEIACFSCGYTEDIVAFSQGFPNTPNGCWGFWGYQCQSCGKFHTVEIEKAVKPYICSCGGELRRNKPLFCPQCKSTNMEYGCHYIT